MLWKKRYLAAVILLAVQAAQPAFGQEGPNPSQSLSLAGRVAGGPPCNPYEDCNGPLLKGDCGLDSPSWAPPGWFFAVEADLVGTHIKNRLVNQVGNDTVHLPTAELDWTVSPRFEAGYRFAQGAGELVLAYKFLATTGTETLAGFDTSDNPANLHSRLDINAWDIDYGSREYSLWPCWDMKWRAGVRMAGVFFDSTATSPLLEQHVSNYFFGAGPHVGLDLRRFVQGTGIQLMGRVETAFVIGQTMQTFEETVTVPGVGAVAGANRFSETLIAPWLGVQAGVGWTPPGLEQLTVSAGYAFECWWDLADVGNSRGDITTQGVFFRAEFRY